MLKGKKSEQCHAYVDARNSAKYILAKIFFFQTIKVRPDVTFDSMCIHDVLINTLVVVRPTTSILIRIK